MSTKDELVSKYSKGPRRRRRFRMGGRRKGAASSAHTNRQKRFLANNKKAHLDREAQFRANEKAGRPQKGEEGLSRTQIAARRGRQRKFMAQQAAAHKGREQRYLRNKRLKKDDPEARDLIAKYNHNHGKDGKFTSSGNGGGKGSGSKAKVQGGGGARGMAPKGKAPKSASTKGGKVAGKTLNSRQYAEYRAIPTSGGKAAYRQSRSESGPGSTHRKGMQAVASHARRRAVMDSTYGTVNGRKPAATKATAKKLPTGAVGLSPGMSHTVGGRRVKATAGTKGHRDTSYSTNIGTARAWTDKKTGKHYAEGKLNRSKTGTAAREFSTASQAHKAAIASVSRGNPIPAPRGAKAATKKAPAKANTSASVTPGKPIKTKSYDQAKEMARGSKSRADLEALRPDKGMLNAYHNSRSGGASHSAALKVASGARGSGQTSVARSSTKTAKKTTRRKA